MQCDYEECDCDDCCGTPIRGFQGLEGPASFGIPGPQGYAGPEYVAPQGAQGMQGPPCCDMDSLRGPQGTQGPQGQNIDGPQGPVGFQGLSLNGFFGPQGQDGYQGFQGLDHVGMQGFQGATQAGLKGAQGFQGSVGIAAIGTRGPQGPTQITTQFQGPFNFSFTPNPTGTISAFATPSADLYLVSVTFSVVDTLAPAQGSNIRFFAGSDNLNVLVQNGNSTTNQTFVCLDHITSGTVTIGFGANQTAQLNIFNFTIIFTRLS